MTDKTYRNDGDEQFAELAGRRLKEANDSLDAATLSKLNQSRQTALAELGKPYTGIAGRRWVPAGALAASLLVATVLWLGRDQQTGGVDPLGEQFANQLGDLDLLAAEEDFEFYDELEFYSWLGSELDLLDEDADVDQLGQG